MRINWGPFLPSFYLLNRKVFVQIFSEISSQITDPPKTIVHWGEIINKDQTMVDYFLARVQLHGFLIFILYMKKPDTQAQFYW